MKHRHPASQPVIQPVTVPGLSSFSWSSGWFSPYLLLAFSLGLAIAPIAPTQAQTQHFPAPATRLTQAATLPSLVERVVLRDVAQRSGLSPEQLRITRYQADIWPDGCLGLGSEGQVCSQSLVSGWRVTVEAATDEAATNTAPTWTYRSNASGRTIALESTTTPNLTARPRGVIGDSSTSTAPLPEELQPPVAQLTPLGGEIRIILVNRTNATLTYQVIGDTTLRTLAGQERIILDLLEVPATLTFRRDDGGLLEVSAAVQGEQAHSLEVTLDTATDFSRDRTTLTVERAGEVFLN